MKRVKMLTILAALGAALCIAADSSTMSGDTTGNPPKKGQPPTYSPTTFWGTLYS
jgi:hypothetical protein